MSGSQKSPSTKCARWACAGCWSIAPTTIAAIGPRSVATNGRTAFGSSNIEARFRRHQGCRPSSEFPLVPGRRRSRRILRRNDRRNSRLAHGTMLIARAVTVVLARSRPSPRPPGIVPCSSRRRALAVCRGTCLVMGWRLSGGMWQGPLRAGLLGGIVPHSAVTKAASC